MLKRSQDHFDMGVPEVWIFDPTSRAVYVCTKAGTTEHKDGVLKLANTLVELPVAGVFATLDE